MARWENFSHYVALILKQTYPTIYAKCLGKSWLNPHAEICTNGCRIRTTVPEYTTSSNSPQSIDTESGAAEASSVFTFWIPKLISETSPRRPTLQHPKYSKICFFFEFFGPGCFKCFRLGVRLYNSKQGAKPISGDWLCILRTRRLSGWARLRDKTFLRMWLVSKVIGLSFSSSITSPGSIF